MLKIYKLVDELASKIFQLKSQKCRVDETLSD